MKKILPYLLYGNTGGDESSKITNKGELTKRVYDVDNRCYCADEPSLAKLRNKTGRHFVRRFV